MLVGGIGLTMVQGAMMAPFAAGAIMQAMSGNADSVAEPGGLVYTAVSAAVCGIGSLLTQIFIVAIYVCLRQSREASTPDMAAAVFE
jgi:hypothetical protein